MASNASNLLPHLQRPRLTRAERNTSIQGFVTELRKTQSKSAIEVIVVKVLNTMDQEIGHCEAEISILNSRNANLQQQISAAAIGNLQVRRF